jgi:hypothetical protein
VEKFKIEGSSFNDRLVGGDFDDTLVGGLGNDVISGVNERSDKPGRREIDNLIGGDGLDKFMLGDINKAWYDDGLLDSSGADDYAIISDFSPSNDIIQLYGQPRDYFLTVNGNSANIYIDKPGSEPDELIAVIDNQVELNLYSNCFSYVSDQNFPRITLDLVPRTSVLEDGLPNLDFFLSRGVANIASALTVNYTVAGTATLGTDYTGIATTPPTKTVTFAAGSAYASVIVDPTADAEFEADESIVLTLAPGNGYFISTRATATGTIRNDDTTLESQGNAKLLRRGDGLAFVEVGSSRQQVTAPWGATAGGFSETWQMLAAETLGSTNTVLFRYNPTSSLHTWTLDANWAWQSSSGLISANSNEGLALESAFQLDLNSDGVIASPYTTLESQGNAKLLRRNDGLAFVEVGSSRQQVTAPWGATAGGPTETWQMLGAETLGSTNTVLFRHNPTSSLHTWTLNANWGWQSSSGLIEPNSSQGLNLETAFNVDANRDGIIGGYTTLDANGNTKLLRRNDGLPFVEVGSTRQQVTAPWGATTGGSSETWQILAAESLGGVNTVLLRNNSANFLHTWILDASWSWTASNGTVSPSSPQGSALLAQFGLS